jgi:hypothetical protein
MPDFGYLWRIAQDNMDYRGIWANFFGGLGLAALLFFIRETFRPKQNLSGEWIVENTVTNTAYNPYVGMRVIWKVHILQNQYSITGSGEKIKEIGPDGTDFEYEPAKRDAVELTGYVERNYFKRNVIFINSIQVGRLRRSRATYALNWAKDALTGTFATTAGDAKGPSVFKRNAEGN